MHLSPFLRAASTLIITATLVAAGASSGSAVSSAKLSAKCEKAVSKLVVALAKEPTGTSEKAQAKYRQACPTGPQVEIRGLGQNSTTQAKGADTDRVGVKSVKSSDPLVVFIGPAKDGKFEGTPTTQAVQTVVGVGRATVCVAWRDKSESCTLVVVPKAITTKPYTQGDTSYGLVTGVGASPDSGVELAETSSTNPAAVEAFDSGVNVVAPGRATVCMKFTPGNRSCQTWRVVAG